AVFVVRADVEAPAAGGVGAEVADQAEERERALGVLLHADSIAIQAAEVEAAEVVARAAGAAVASTLVEPGGEVEVGAHAGAVLRDVPQVRAGEGVAGVAGLLVCGRALGRVAEGEAEAIA